MLSLPGRKLGNDWFKGTEWPDIAATLFEKGKVSTEPGGLHAIVP
jgi:hypothetical protein